MATMRDAINGFVEQLGRTSDEIVQVFYAPNNSLKVYVLFDDSTWMVIEAKPSQN